MPHCGCRHIIFKHELQLNKNNRNIDWNSQFLFYFPSTYLVASRFVDSFVWMFRNNGNGCRIVAHFIPPFICSENKEITIEIVSFKWKCCCYFYCFVFNFQQHNKFNKSFVAHTNTHTHTPSQHSAAHKRKNLSFIEWNGIKYVNKVKYTTKQSQTKRQTPKLFDEPTSFWFWCGQFLFLFAENSTGKEKTLCSSWFWFRWNVTTISYRTAFSRTHENNSPPNPLWRQRKKHVNDICIYLHMAGNLICGTYPKLCSLAMSFACSLVWTVTFDISIWSLSFHWKWNNELKI